jgi:DNA-binding NarL/FixJ family response regulator
MDEHSEAPRELWMLLSLVLTGVIVGGAIDIWLDGAAAWWTVHTLLEMTLVLFSAGCLLYLWRGWRRSVAETRVVRSALALTERTLVERQLERDQWRASAEHVVSGLARAIDSQFDQWALTPAEREVAMGLLQGRGHKQIAGTSGRSERTVRQHAVSVYAKSGLGGRAELAAFFLQDLTPPASRSA